LKGKTGAVYLILRRALKKEGKGGRGRRLEGEQFRVLRERRWQAKNKKEYGPTSYAG